MTFVLLIAIYSLSPIVYAAIVNKSQSVTVTATVYGPPPTTPAIITYPTSNSTFGVSPIVIRGTCGAGLTVHIFDNDSLIGTTICAADNTFAINAVLGLGTNVLSALNYDFQDQPGPSSGSVSVAIINVSRANVPQTAVPDSNKTQPISSSKEITPTNANLSEPLTQAVRSYVHRTWQLTIVITIVLTVVTWMLVVFLHRHRLSKTIAKQERPNQL